MKATGLLFPVKSYTMDARAFDGIDLSIGEGTLLGIMCPNGTTRGFHVVDVRMYRIKHVHPSVSLFHRLLNEKTSVFIDLVRRIMEILRENIWQHAIDYRRWKEN